jgi:hypothetical protein
MTNRLFLFLAASTLVVGSAGWAAAAGSHSLDTRLSHATLVNGTTIPAGDYRFSWTGDTPKVEVTIKQDGRVVASVPAKVEDRGKAARQDEIITRTSKSGTPTLEELRLRGQTEVLVFAAS